VKVGSQRLHFFSPQSQDLVAGYLAHLRGLPGANVGKFTVVDLAAIITLYLLYPF
jgi:hypothetical protein